MSEALILLLALNLKAGDRVTYRVDPRINEWVCGTVAETKREPFPLVMIYADGVARYTALSIAPDEVVKGCAR